MRPFSCSLVLLILLLTLALAAGLGFGAVYTELAFGRGLPWTAVKSARALDGDTVEVVLVVHIDGFDAPELDSQRCEEERRRAVISRDRANELLSHPPVRVKLYGEDSRGKLGAGLVAGDRPLGLMLESEGHLRRSNGSSPLNWCPGESRNHLSPIQNFLAGP
jgi:endonuclease YncB( thermonuclease family)